MHQQAIILQVRKHHIDIILSIISSNSLKGPEHMKKHPTRGAFSYAPAEKSVYTLFVRTRRPCQRFFKENRDKVYRSCNERVPAAGGESAGSTFVRTRKGCQVFWKNTDNLYWLYNNRDSCRGLERCKGIFRQDSKTLPTIFQRKS